VTGILITKKSFRIVLTPERTGVNLFDMNPDMNLPLVMEIAKRNLNSNASANLCFADAERVLARGYPVHAAIHAMKSLSHSVGILHADYAEAWKACGQADSPRLPGFLWNWFAREFRA